MVLKLKMALEVKTTSKMETTSKWRRLKHEDDFIHELGLKFDDNLKCEDEPLWHAGPSNWIRLFSIQTSWTLALGLALWKANNLNNNVNLWNCECLQFENLFWKVMKVRIQRAHLLSWSHDKNDSVKNNDKHWALRRECLMMDPDKNDCGNPAKGFIHTMTIWTQEAFTHEKTKQTRGPAHLGTTQVSRI